MVHVKYIALLLLVFNLSKKGDLSRSIDWKYVGCFRHDEGVFSKKPLVTHNSFSSIPECMSHCQSQGHSLAGLALGGRCYCGDNHNGKPLTPSDDCSMRCVLDTSKFCGHEAHGILSVYRAFPDNYLGCFRDDSDGVLARGNHDRSGKNVHDCMWLCSTQGYPLAGLEYGGYCWCGGKPGEDNVYRLGRADNCDKPCVDDRSTMCGGMWALSVYKTGSWNYGRMYFGCFRDDASRVLPVRSVGLTIEQCVMNCRALGYRLAGAEGGGQCFCGEPDTLYRLGRTDDCVAPCRNDTSAMCGGDWALSVYRTTEDNYLGCFLDDFRRVLLSSTEYRMDKQTIQACIKRCKAQGYELAGLEDGTQCFCGGKAGDEDNVYRLGPSRKCNVPCPGDRDTVCGGSFALSVYRTNTWTFDDLGLYVDCFRDDETRVLLNDSFQRDASQTVPKCIERCKSLGYRLAGLEDGDQCYCGGLPGGSDNVWRLGRADNCNKPCFGDRHSVCGGRWALSVYRVDRIVFNDPRARTFSKHGETDVDEDVSHGITHGIAKGIGNNLTIIGTLGMSVGVAFMIGLAIGVTLFVAAWVRKWKKTRGEKYIPGKATIEKKYARIHFIDVSYM